MQLLATINECKPVQETETKSSIFEAHSNGITIKDNTIALEMCCSKRSVYGKHILNPNSNCPCSNNNLIIQYKFKIIQTRDGNIDIGLTDGDNIDNMSHLENLRNYGIKTGDEICMKLCWINGKVMQLSFRCNGRKIVSKHAYIDKKLLEKKSYRLGINLYNQSDCISIEKMETYQSQQQQVDSKKRAQRNDNCPRQSKYNAIAAESAESDKQKRKCKVLWTWNAFCFHADRCCLYLTDHFVLVSATFPSIFCFWFFVVAHAIYPVG